MLNILQTYSWSLMSPILKQEYRSLSESPNINRPKGKSKKKDPEADVPVGDEPESADTKRRREHCDDFDVKLLRMANGISKDAFITRGHLPQKIEITRRSLFKNS